MGNALFGEFTFSEFERQQLVQIADMLGQLAAFTGQPTRDQLAAGFAQAIVSKFREPADAAVNAPGIAEDAYRLADALLAERERRDAPVPVQIAKPCGCVTCVCADPERCHGCGATTCAEHAKGPLARGSP